MAKSMQSAQTLKDTTPKLRVAKTDGNLVWQCAIGVGAIYSALIAVMLVIEPELMNFAPIWFLWTVVTVGAIGTYVLGQAFHRRSLVG
jgi:hypothetical protein